MTADILAIPQPPNATDALGLLAAQDYCGFWLANPPAAFAGKQMWIRGSGTYDGNCIRLEVSIQPIDGVLNQQIMVTPDKNASQLPT